MLVVLMRYRCTCISCPFIAQVLAGALKDNRRAAVAGEDTFGKGLIQASVGAGLAQLCWLYHCPCF